MPDIVPFYNIVSGQAFNPGSWNRTLYNPTANDSFEVKNGRIEAANLHGSFLAQPQHIRRGQASVSESSGTREPLQYFDELTTPTEDWTIALPGASKTIYQRWQAGSVLVSFQLFCSIWLPEGTLEASTVLFASGSQVQHTRRKLPITVWPRSATKGAETNNVLFIEEHYNTRLRTQTHLIQNLAEGEHTFSVRLHLQPNPGFTSLDRYFDWTANGGAAVDTELRPRLTVGVRNMTVLRVL